MTRTPTTAGGHPRPAAHAGEMVSAARRYDAWFTTGNRTPATDRGRGGRRYKLKERRAP